MLLFLVSLFLIKTPPFYIVPFFQSGLLTTHTLARVIIGYLFLKVFLIDKKSFAKKQRSLIIIFLVYFGLLSASVISAGNLNDFFLRYKDLLFPGLFLFLTLAFKGIQKPIINVFLWTAVINFVYQIIIFINPNFFVSFASFFVYSKHLDLVFINLSRARIFIETYDEITIPFVFLLLAQSKDSKNKTFLYLTLILISLPSFLSNFRSRILMMIFSYGASLFFLMPKKFAQLTKVLLLIIVVGFVSYSVLNYNFNFSFLDRFALADKREDVNTIVYRWNNIVVSEEMARSKPLFGVGLGNYYDNLPAEKKNAIAFLNWENKEAGIASTNPHNIFAQILSESGFVSLIFYFIMISYFIIADVKVMFGPKKQAKAGVISFWSLFIYSLFNPTTTLAYNSLFWVLRAFITNEDTN